MNTKVLSILWFVGGAIFGIVLAYTLGTQTVFEPIDVVVNQPSVTTTTDTPSQDNTPKLTGDIIIASSTAPELNPADFKGEIPIKKTFSLKTSKSVDNIDASTAGLFTATPFRTIAMAQDPSGESHYSVVVAATRNNEPNHDVCGSLYSTSRACYFFLEPKSYADLSEKTVYLGRLQSGGLNPSSLKFTSTSTLEFTTGEGDAGFAVQYFWELNLNTRTISLKKEVNTEIEYDKDGKETEKITTRP